MLLMNNLKGNNLHRLRRVIPVHPFEGSEAIKEEAVTLCLYMLGNSHACVQDKCLTVPWDIKGRTVLLLFAVKAIPQSACVTQS